MSAYDLGKIRDQRARTNMVEREISPEISYPCNSSRRPSTSSSINPSSMTASSISTASTISISAASTISEAFPLRKVEILETLDTAKTQWYHFTTILVAGSGFFTDAYDLFSISVITKLLGRIYYYDPSKSGPGELPINVRLAVSAMALCGTLIGALFFGVMGDRFGRRKVYGVTLFLMILCSIGSSLSLGSTAKSVMTTLCFFRFWLGFGIGGDYPLSATIMSEYSNVKTRGAFIGSVFALQGLGILFGATVGIIVSAAFKHRFPSPSFSVDRIRSTPHQSDFLWRIILLIGALPALLTLYFRLRLPETARFTALVEGNVLKATQDMERVLDLSDTFDKRIGRWETKSRALFSHEFARRFGSQLLGTCTTWFLLDVTFYSQNLFQDEVLTDVGWLPPRNSMSAIEEVFQVSRSQALIAMCATVPGYWVTVFTVEKLGRRAIQIQGFFFMMTFVLIAGLSFSHLRGKQNSDNETYTGGHHILFFLLYSLIFFFCNFGPNTTTFIVPAELFPAVLRSTCFGLSAAAGKLGAIVGNFGFLYAKQNQDKGHPTGIGVRGAFLMLAVLNFLGCVISYLYIPETKGKSLEALSGDFDYGMLKEPEDLNDSQPLPQGVQEPLEHDSGINTSSQNPARPHLL